MDESLIIQEILEEIKSVMELEISAFDPTLDVSLTPENVISCRMSKWGSEVRFSKNPIINSGKSYTVYLNMYTYPNLLVYFGVKRKYTVKITTYSRLRKLFTDTIDSNRYPIIHDIIKLGNELERLQRYEGLKFIVNGEKQ